MKQWQWFQRDPDRASVRAHLRAMAAIGRAVERVLTGGGGVKW